MLLSLEPDIDVVGEADDGYEAIKLAAELRPDVLIADISMPGPGGIEIAQQLRDLLPSCRVVVLTMHEDLNLVRQALDAGAMGYIVKRAAESELVKAVHLAACGQIYIDAGLHAASVRAGIAPPSEPLAHATALPRALPDPASPCATVELSPAEIRLLCMLAQGFVMSQVSQELGKDAAITEEMRKDVMTRLGLRGRVDIMRFVRERGLLGE
jgi:DNA-binding NarL/FixJ family response regulator